MSSNIREFELGLQRFQQNSEQRGLDLFRGVGLEAARGVVLATPVDTGRARGNWQTTIDTPAEGDLNVSYGSGGSGAGAAANDALGRAQTAIAGVRRFGLIWLHNGVEYIQDLEDGTLRTRAHMMVGRTVARLRAFVGSIR